MEFRRSSVWLFAALLTSGCGTDKSEGVDTASNESPRQGSIRVVNAIEDGPTLTAVLRAVDSDSEATFGSAGYAGATALAKTLVGRYEMDVVYDTPSATRETLVEGESIELTEEDEVSLFLVGQLSDYQLIRIDNVEIDYKVDSSDSSTWPQPQIQVVDASRGAGSVTVYVTANKVPIVNATPLAVLDYGEISDLQTLDSSTTYRIRVTREGSSDVIFDSGDVMFSTVTRTVLLIYDQFVPDGVELRVTRIDSTGTNPFPNDTSQAALRFTNLVADVAAVDVYVGDTADAPIFSNVSFGGTARYVHLDADTYNVNVTPTGVQNRFVYQGPLTVASGSVGTLYVAGDLSNDDIRVQSAMLADDPRSVVSQVAFHFINGAGSAGAVNAYLLAPGQPYGDATPFLADGALMSDESAARDSGQYDLVVTDSDDRSVLFGPQRLDLELGGTYRAMLTDNAGGGMPLSLILERDEAAQ